MTNRVLALMGAGSLLLSVVSASSAAAGDWPQWRGPNRDDVSTETGLLKEWPAGGPRLVWKATGLGTGHGGISISGQIIFCMGEKDGSNYVRALSVAGGKLEWSAPAGQGGSPGGTAGPRGTPSVEGGLVYALGQHGGLVCVQAADGKEVWSKRLIEDFGGAEPNWGYSESPLVDGERVLCTPGGAKGTIVALNKRTGELLWQSAEWKDNAHYSSIIVAEIGGVRQYIQLTDASVAGVAASDGKLLWKAARKGETAVAPTPICADDLVYVTSGYGASCHLFKVTAEAGRFSAAQVYANRVMVNHHGGVLKLGEYLYGYSEGKGWTCQNFKTGESVWAEKGKLGKGSVTCADGLLFCREEGSGVVALVEATPKGYKEHGRLKQPDRTKENSWAHPVVAGGRLYLRDQDALFCYDVKTK